MKITEFYGATWCPDCHQLKRFLGEHKIDYHWVDIEKDPAAMAKVKELAPGNTIPVLVFDDGSLLIEPTNQQLAEKLEIKLESTANYCDLAIVGAGPTGLSAAIYTTREDIKTTIFEKAVVGGLTGITDQIDNYPGFPEGVTGISLADAMEKQARRFGAEFKVGAEVTNISEEGKYKKLATSEGEYYAKSVLIGTGSDYRKLNIPGEKEFTSKGVHYCATCDGPVYRGKELIVIGGGNSAMQESLFLVRFASKITMLIRGDELKGTELLINKVKSMHQIQIHSGFNTSEIRREGEKMVVEGASNKTNQTAQFSADGIFVFIGLIPNTQFLQGTVDLDDSGFVKTDKMFQTNLRGVYAAGDVRSGATLQIASAVGEGVTAALMIREYLKEEG